MERNRTVDIIVLLCVLFAFWVWCVEYKGDTWTKKFGWVFPHRNNRLTME